MTRTMRLICALLLMILATGATAVSAQDDEEGTYQLLAYSVAPMLDADGTQIGTVAIGDDGEGGVGMIVMVQGLTPGDHGLHMHEKGNCDPAGEKTFEQAGAHFNPGGMTHPSHAGDYGNLIADANGNAILLGTLPTVTWDAGEWGLADADGTALVIHADPDDLVTDPSGNSGSRIACAVLSAPAS